MFQHRKQRNKSKRIKSRWFAFDDCNYEDDEAVVGDVVVAAATGVLPRARIRSR